ncbi:hypothetical protein BEWA_035690 [Theileria equi strain WA]|uniref:Uncharacterized protein n=1 Tax=Theileria equi strain WA TaxID=1537102 RepID=L1LED1_THEEQ|nr:hypothetical protein BEWA_035690 [Theileria equi strain WA]EKX73533.1 hypothetical protein BEWA_035690 [Theileria equi strain WA]|eukprot:XP_004832985.1 hypothetical protein BEWA_035690 [Theileria equi strain WA]
MDPPTKVLLVGVTTGSGGTKYYVRGTGDKWIELEQLSKDAEALEKILDDLVCQYYNRVTIDLTKSISTGQQYCCSEHKGNKGRISVEPKTVSCQEHSSSSSITTYRHSVQGGSLAKIKYYENGLLSSEQHRRRITAPELNFPIPGLLSVHAFYCGKNPVLIYVDGGSDTGWYKKPTNSSSGKDEKWTPVKDLNGITPEKINDCKTWNKVVGELKNRSNGLQDCPQEPERQEPPLEKKSEDKSDEQDVVQPGPSGMKLLKLMELK